MSKLLEDLSRMSKGLEPVHQEKPKIENKTTCSICNENKTRLTHSLMKNGTKRYVDENGKFWKGRKCPECIKVEHREYMRQARGTRNPRV